MGYVNAPFRVLYEAKGFRSGLTNVRAVVFKPDKSIAGPYMMVEMPMAFAGRYYFDLITGANDPSGEYLVAIFSPSEALQTTLRVSLYGLPVQATDARIANLDQAVSSRASAADLAIDFSAVSLDVEALVKATASIKNSADLIAVTVL